MRMSDSLSSLLDGLRRAGRLRNRVEKLEELRKGEGALRGRASVNYRGSDMHLLEAEHEVVCLEIAGGDVSCPVAGKVDAKAFGDLHRLGEGRHRPELESSQGCDRDR